VLLRKSSLIKIDNVSWEPISLINLNHFQILVEFILIHSITLSGHL